MSIVTFLESVSQEVTHADLLSGGSAWSTRTWVGINWYWVCTWVCVNWCCVCTWVCVNWYGICMVLVKLLKVGRIASHRLVTSFSRQHTVVLVFWLSVRLGGMVWRTSPSLVALPIQYLQPVCENPSGLLLSAWVFILSFWYASSSGISAGFKFVLHGTATGQGSLILIGFPMRAVAGATPVVLPVRSCAEHRAKCFHEAFHFAICFWP